MTDQEQPLTPADTGVVTSGLGTKTPEERKLPDSLSNDMELCLEILRGVLAEYDESLLTMFDTVRQYAVDASAERFSGVLTDTHPERDDLEMAVKTIDAMNLHDAQLLARAFATYFHLANLCEENYRVSVLHEREAKVDGKQAIDPVNEMTKAYHQLIAEMGPAQAKELLGRLEFHPVFTAHPTEARRKAVEGKIRRIAELLSAHKYLGGSDKKENLRRLYNEIDALFRTSPTALKKPTPVEEADTILDIFDNTLFHTIPQVYRRFDDWVLGDEAGLVEPVCPAFFHPGSWIGSDRDGNPNVTAKVSRQVARKFSDHVLAALEEATRTVGRNMTMESETTPPSDELRALWNQQKEVSERLTSKASLISTQELHRAVLLVMADRLHYTIKRDHDLMYHTCDDFLADLRIVQRSLAEAGAKRAAYGPLQDLIWQTETFGFHMVEMEFRQHSVVHARALDDIREHGLHGERGPLQPMTHEVLDTFRALGAIQRRNGVKAARRYIISFTKSAKNVRDVYELNRLSFANPEDAPVIDVIPLFEQLEDLENSVNVLDEMIKIPEVQARLKQTGRKLEVMLGYSDSSKDAGPTTATLALHSAQERIAKWADENDIDLTLFHGRGGAVGRGGGPANRAV
ncbi:phosphoenolpyruvate carboxylase, partial [Bifidobacterium pseudolongum]